MGSRQAVHGYLLRKQIPWNYSEPAWMGWRLMLMGWV